MARQHSEPRQAAGGRWPLIVVVAATLAAALLWEVGAFTGLTGQAHDALVRARAAADGDSVPATVVLIEVDGPTVAAQQGLPIPRSAYAKAIRRLYALGAAAIAIDLQFSEPSEFEDEDEAFLAAMQDTRVPIVLATSEVLRDGDTAVFGGTVNLEPAGAVAAHSAIPNDVDGTLRRVGRTVDGLDTLTQATTKAVGSRGLEADEILIDPSIPANHLERISLQTLIEDRPRDRQALSRRIQGRVAIIGVTAVGPSGDDFERIAGSQREYPGVMAQAQAIDTVLRGAPLRDGGRVAAVLLALAASLIAALGTLGRMRIQLLSVVAAAVLVVVVSVVAIWSGLLVDPILAVAALVLAGTLAAAVRAAAERERRAVARATLARFVPPGVVDALLDGSREGQLAPQAQTASVLFCDLRGYTALVAGLERPEGLIAVLDTYLTEVTETIHRHGGTVVSFQGDGVMSAFGVPSPTDEAAAQAVAAARDLLEVALPRVCAALRDVVPDRADGLALGVGVATGPVFAGTVGPAARREYAVVGPTTNLAARLQALTKTEGVAVLVDDATATATTAAPTTATAATAAAAAATRGPGGHRSRTGIDLGVEAGEGTGGLRLLGPREIRGLPRPIDVWTTA